MIKFSIEKRVLHSFLVTFSVFFFLISSILISILFSAVTKLSQELTGLKAEFNVLNHSLKQTLTEHTDLVHKLNVVAAVDANFQTEIYNLTTTVVVFTVIVFILIGAVYFGGSNTGPGAAGTGVLNITSSVKPISFTDEIINPSLQDEAPRGLELCGQLLYAGGAENTANYDFSDTERMTIFKLGDFASSYAYSSYDLFQHCGKPTIIILNPHAQELLLSDEFICCVMEIV